MSENLPPKESLAGEFQNLGKNLANLLQTAWDNPERKRVQKEFETSLAELGDSIKREAEYFAESPTAQRLKDDVEGLGERIRSTETQEKLRQEVINILQTANNELKKVIEKWSADKPVETGGTPPGEPADEE